MQLKRGGGAGEHYQDDIQILASAGKRTRRTFLHSSKNQHSGLMNGL